LDEKFQYSFFKQGKFNLFSIESKANPKTSSKFIENLADFLKPEPFFYLMIERAKMIFILGMPCFFILALPLLLARGTRPWSLDLRSWLKHGMTEFASMHKGTSGLV